MGTACVGKYGYQGQYSEVDKETGWNNFDLRMYDTSIGRWMSTDPESQYHSPYAGMGNNPTMGVDPDGGFFQELKNWMMGNGWISNAGRDFMRKTPGAQYSGWTGDKLTGHATVGYGTKDEKVVMRSFPAVKDYTLKSIWNSPERRLITGDKMGVSAGVDLTAYMGVSLSFEMNWLLTGNDASFFPYLGMTGGFNLADGLNGSVDLTFSRSTHSSSNPNDVTAASLPGKEIGGSIGGKVILGGDVGYSYSQDGKYGWHTASVGVGAGLEISPVTVLNYKVTTSYNFFQFHTGSGRLYR
jgi:RHS repeat-associated protein